MMECSGGSIVIDDGKRRIRIEDNTLFITDELSKREYVVPVLTETGLIVYGLSEYIESGDINDLLFWVQGDISEKLMTLSVPVFLLFLLIGYSHSFNPLLLPSSVIIGIASYTINYRILLLKSVSSIISLFIFLLGLSSIYTVVIGYTIYSVIAYHYRPIIKTSTRNLLIIGSMTLLLPLFGR